MAIRIYEKPVRLNLERFPQQIGAKMKASNFTINQLPKGDEESFFMPGSPIREQLAINPGPQPRALISTLYSDTISKFSKAAPLSIVAGADTYAEGALIMAKLVKSRVSAQYIAAKNSNDGKIYVIKGLEGTELVPLQHFLLPFKTNGPIIDLHPVGTDPMPSIQDYESIMRNGIPFGITLGYGSGLTTEGLKLSKFYTLGPFRTIDVRFVKTEASFDAIFHALSADSEYSRAYYYMLKSNPDRRFGLLKPRLHEIITQYTADMVKWGEKIKSLERDVFINPTKLKVQPQRKKARYTVDFKALELARIYIATQHFLNAILLLEKVGQDRKLTEALGLSEEINELMRLAYTGMHDLTLEDIHKTLDVEGA